MNKNKIVVLKFGSSVLAHDCDLQTVVCEIQRTLNTGHRVIAVVSAFGDTTNELTSRAKQISNNPDECIFATFLATGEAQSAALLGLALKQAGIATRILDAHKARLRSDGPQLDSDLVSVDVELIQRELESNVVILPGFVGVSANGETSLLGRGGSDLTALFLADQLNGTCVLLKDVDGLYTTDPNSATTPACGPMSDKLQLVARYVKVSYETACSVGGAVVQAKAIRYAQKRGQVFRITSIGSSKFTEVGEFVDAVSDETIRLILPQTRETHRLGTATRCVQLGTSDDQYGAIVPPIYQTATFQQPGASEFGEFDYTRSGNPTRRLLERQLADLEEGTHACAFASGLAAITALIRAVVKDGEIIAGDDLYGGTVRLLERIREQQNIRVHYVDTSDVNAVKSVITRDTQLILIETPTNPLFQIADIRALARVAGNSNAILAVDNSMLSPIFQRPLSLGADVVIHSATKFLCGHSDVTAGAVITKDAELHRRIAFQQNAEGAGLSPFESWLLLRGLKTLSLRVKQQSRSAREVAEFLVGHPDIQQVYYPGLSGHVGSEVHRQQSQGDGAVVSFTTGDREFSRRLVEATKLFKIAVSFGSVGSTISLPCQMSHASIPASLRSRLAPPPDLVRISVGVEDVFDLIDDLAHAFTAAAQLVQLQQAIS
jgi:cystathionine beta-lyase